MAFHIILEEQENGGFVAHVPELPGCHTQAETREEALENTREAKELYLEVLKHKKNAPLPHVEVLPF